MNLKKGESVHVWSQGSILAPTLFLINVNDNLDTYLYSKASAYAEDTVLMTKAEDIQTLEQLCNTDLQLINRWCCDNRMVLNMNKSHFMMLRPSVRVPDSDLDLWVKIKNYVENLKPDFSVLS